MVNLKFKFLSFMLGSLLLFTSCQNTATNPVNPVSPSPNNSDLTPPSTVTSNVKLSINGEKKELSGNPLVRVYNLNFIEITQNFKTSDNDTNASGKFYVRFNSKGNDIDLANPDPSKIVQINELTFLDQKFTGILKNSEVTKWEIKKEGSNFVGFIKKDKDDISSGFSFDFNVEIPKQ